MTLEIQTDEAVILADRMNVTIGYERGRRKRRSITIHEADGDGYITIVFSKKGRDATFFINDIELDVSMPKMRNFANDGHWHWTDTLISMGWTPPPHPDDDPEAAEGEFALPA